MRFRRKDCVQSVISMGVLIACAGIVHAEEHEPADPMEKLSWLVGNWTFEDTQVNGPYRERGSRDCIKTLDDAYIRCESKGVSHTGHERVYHFILGYNRTDQRYEMIGLTSTYPRQSLYTIQLSEDGHTLQLQNHFWTADGLEPLSSATIQYNGTDKYVWEIRNGEVDPVSGERSVGFVDRVQRVN